MNLKVISRNIGYALLVSALFMLLSIFVSLANGRDSALSALLISFSLTFIVGIFPFIFVRRTENITLTDGYMIIVLSWLLSFIFGMLPYALWGGPFTLDNAWFESVSGFTATGATILENVEELPRSLLFWRASTHFIGGLGVVVFLLLIIPNSSPVRLRLTNMELSSLSKDGYSTRANKTVYIFAYVYLAIVAASFLSYLCCGMSVFDAVCHAFSVSATGGFSTRTASIGAFHSIAVDIVTMVFMIFASMHFGLLYMTVVSHSLRSMRSNPVLKFYLSYLVVVIVMVTVNIRLQVPEMSWGKAILEGSFTTVSYASTTGFAISDNAAWPMFSGFLLLLVGFICGCAGSTTGGVKADRILVLIKALGRQIRSSIHPSYVGGIKMGRRLLKDEDVYPHILYLSIFIVFAMISIVLSYIFGAKDLDAVCGTLSSICNVGPSLGERIGSMGNYNSQPTAIKIIFSLDMFLGRVEIYPVLAVFSMIFRRKGRI